MFDSDELKGKWAEIKGEIAKKWGELTHDDLERTKGNFGSLVGLLQQKLGLKKEEAHQQLSEIGESWKTKLANSANQKIDEQKDKLKH